MSGLVDMMDNSIIVFSELTFILEFLLRVEHTLAQTDDEDVLLNLQFLKKELETFIDGFDFKGFFFPVKYAFVQPLMKNRKKQIFVIVTLKEYKLTFKSWHLGLHLSLSQTTKT